MKRFAILLMLSFILVQSYAQVTTNIYWTEETSLSPADNIYYKPNANLFWADFRGVPVLTGNVAAITSSGFGYKAGMKTNGTKGQVNIGVYCYFNKKLSWVKPDKKTAYILNHEQHHFDISYIAAKTFIDKLRAANITPATMNTVLPALYKECTALMNKMQDDYDGQTRNGQVPEVQAAWNKTISQKLFSFID